MHTVVTGGTGAVGPALVSRLVALSHDVTAIARHEVETSALPAGVRFARADLSSDPPPDAVREADVIFHLAARLHVNDPGPSLAALYERDNVEATRRVVQVMRPDALLVFFSTIDVYGPTAPGDTADESSEPHPRSLYGATKLRAEAVALQHPHAVVLRLAAVYGTRMKGNYARLVRTIRRGIYLQVGRGTNRRTLVHDSDVAAAAVLVAADPRARGRIYNVTDGAVHTVAEIVTAIAAGCGRTPRPWYLPVAPVRAGARVVEAAARIAGARAPLTSAMVDKLQEDVAVSGRRLIDELNFRPRMDLVSGWHATIDHMTHV